MDAKSPEYPSPESEFLDERAGEIVDALLYEPNLHVIGVGGCGCNTIEHITEQEIDNVKTIGINTDERVLEDLKADRQMLIGKDLTNGDGTNGDPKVGKRAAQQSEEQILKSIDESDMVVIVAGLGGGTGSGASKVIADLARRNGKMVFTYAVMPFSVESERRHKRAENVLDHLSKLSHATTVFDNDKTLAQEGQSMKDAFAMADKMLYEVVKNLQMDYITEFFEEIGLDATDLSETISEVEDEEEEEKEISEPPVLEALKYVEENVEEEQQEEQVEDHVEEPRLDDFLENYVH
ncbi:MAG: hypothetical protein V5A66_05600 [Candidatus Thermoplasmatota archaeon]